jgi:hypothetical protein
MASKFQASHQQQRDRTSSDGEASLQGHHRPTSYSQRQWFNEPNSTIALEDRCRSAPVVMGARRSLKPYVRRPMDKTHDLGHFSSNDAVSSLMDAEVEEDDDEFDDVKLV